MEVFQKLKAKLAEGEADSESDREQQQQQHSSGGVRRREGGDNGDRAEALEAEVMELKEHINKNYFVYVRRLEKRKERIKELEEYAKLLIKDNEALQEKQRELEGMLKPKGNSVIAKVQLYRVIDAFKQLFDRNR